MEQIRIIIQQRASGMSIRSISRNTGISRNTVRGYLRGIKAGGYQYSESLELNDEELAGLCFKPEDTPSAEAIYDQLSEKLPEYARSLNQRHVTRQLLWEEYKEQYHEGYGYTRFCHYLNFHIGKSDVTAVFSHIPGDKLQVDFAGDKLSYVDKETGEMIKCDVLVTVLPYSNYIYAEALANQRQQAFLTGLNNALIYIGGVPGCILCDNMKSAVKKADRYEPSFTELTEQLALHYQTTFMATRVRKPRDKASVEGSVNIVYQRIYAKLRNRQFFSLGELNHGIVEELNLLNKRLLKGKDHSRFDVFENYERSKLNPLPPESFEIKKSVMAKVQKNYHIILGEDMHQYSVPYRNTGRKVKVTYTSDRVEIYFDHKRIAIHKRSYRKHSYTTIKEHMPENHRAISEQRGWDADWFLNQAKVIGPNTRKSFEKVLESKAFPEQTYSSCLGILRLGKKYGNDRLETACELALDCPKINYGILKNILKNNMDKLDKEQMKIDFKTPDHDNLRGAKNYY